MQNLIKVISFVYSVPLKYFFWCMCELLCVCVRERWCLCLCSGFGYLTKAATLSIPFGRNFSLLLVVLLIIGVYMSHTNAH